MLACRTQGAQLQVAGQLAMRAPCPSRPNHPTTHHHHQCLPSPWSGSAAAALTPHRSPAGRGWAGPPAPCNQPASKRASPLPHCLQVKEGGIVFFRESCFRQSGDKARKNNPTHYRWGGAAWGRRQLCCWCIFGLIQPGSHSPDDLSPMCCMPAQHALCSRDGLNPWAGGMRKAAWSRSCNTSFVATHTRAPLPAPPVLACAATRESTLGSLTACSNSW